jgi:hypothetical protein
MGRLPRLARYQAAWFIVFLVGLPLLFVSPSAAAHPMPAKSPLYQWTAPYNVTSNDSGAWFNDQSCPNNSYVVHAKPAFNEASGKLRGNSSVTAESPISSFQGYNCSVVGVFGDHLGLAFNSTAGGSHVFRANWKLNWWMSLNATNQSGVISTNAVASAEFWIHEELWDNTTGNAIDQIYYYWSDQVDGGNATTLILSTHLSLPFSTPIVLTRGNHYWIVLTMAAEGVEVADGPGSFAMATMSFDYGGHPSSLLSVRIS